MAELSSYLAAGQTSLSQALFAHFAETALTHREFVVYLFLADWGQHHQEAPALPALAAATKLKQQDLYTVIESLIQKKAVQLVQRQGRGGQLIDQYDVTPLLDAVLKPAGQTVKNQAQTANQQVFSQIEAEFGRPLSPIEQQTITDWLTIDHYAPEMITLALREAVLNQAYSLRYMDRILLNWEKKHLTTPAQVQAEQERHLGL
ncbi:DnaD domain-containing protein [Lacticaseibacillus jixianensis]|uniref:DnaD domain-containing protein n=1 Tax=Lacticaseibacillus jixianensis TaxID=2486012 RepID=A0ABW4BBR1_9LACO|nr:DnaD domain protein [Lacticaseibacillus jixianensis]